MPRRPPSAAMRGSSGRAIVAQAHTCTPSGSMRALTVGMAKSSLRPGRRSAIRHFSASPSRLNASPSASAATAETLGTPAKASTPPSLAPEGTIETARKWTPASKRVGLIAKKVGMTSFFMADGKRVPATVLQISANQISAHIGFYLPTLKPGDPPIAPRKVESRMAYTALQVAATDSSSRWGITKAERGHLRKAGIKKDKKILHEFRVTKDALVPLGTVLSAAHFVPGQKVDVQAKSRGKGFQGPMKRHGFSGLRASHGVSVSHRSHGSTGQNQDPGRVFPGKKMAGRMGGKNSTMQNLEVLRVDTLNDLIVVQGNVPGPEGGHVFMSDAKFDLVKRAAIAFKRGILPDHKGMATGKEGVDVYLPEGIVDLPFPAGTHELAKGLPDIIEVGPKTAAA